MLCQKITWVFVAVLCLAIRKVTSIEIACHVNADNKCVFESNVVWDGKEEFKITNSEELAQSTTDIVFQGPFKTQAIPTAIFVQFPSLKSLTIMDVGLEKISSDDFVEAKQLTHLHIEKNNIGTLKSNSFAAAANLVDLDLSDNQITKIEGLFHGLDKLTKLSLDSNKVVNFDITKYTTLPKLTDLRVAQMDFAFTVPLNYEESKKIIELNSTITKLDLSNNLVDSADLWRRLSIFPNLETAYFTANKITHIDYMDDFKQLLPNVKELIMDENPFETKWLEEAKTYFEKVGVVFRYD
jgi:Leucine-rich repeat (LRR) protein